MDKPIFQRMLLIIILLGLLLPFINKAIHIDDPLFIWTAEHILEDPLHFYDFHVNWYGVQMPMFEVMKNPPLLSYYLALVGKLFGWKEVTLHLSLLIPAVFLVMGIYSLAERLCNRPFWATLAAITTPVFIVSSTTIMCDILMLTFWVWAIYFWLRGIKEDNLLFLGLAALLTALSALTKYYGISLIPLLLCYTLVNRKKFDLRLFFLLIPVVILACYHWLSYAFYGRSLLLDAADYAVETNFQKIATLFIGLSFLGGCLFNSLFWGPLLWKRVSLMVGSMLWLMILAGLYYGKNFGGFPLVDAHGPEWGSLFQASVFILAGVQILALSLVDVYKARDADSLLLLLWVLGTFLFAAMINWAVNGRSILPIVPAVGILLMRRIDATGRLPQLQGKWKLLGPGFASILLALAVSWADYKFADTARTAATEIKETYQLQNGGKGWFQGHWGFQYYMQKNGFQPWDFEKSLLKEDDILVVPEFGSRIYAPSPEFVVLLARIEVPGCRWLAVMNKPAGAGFYCHADIGPFPFVIASVSPETYYVFQQKK